MNRRVIFVFASLMLVASMLLGACAPAATPAPAEPAPAEPAATAAPAVEQPTEAAAMEEVALRWRTRPDNQEEADVYASISDELDAKLEGITLSYEPGGSESSSYQDVLKTEIGAGTAPDVFWIPGTDVGDFAKRGLILNLSDQAAATDGFSIDNFYAGPMAALTHNPDTSAEGADSGALWGSAARRFHLRALPEQRPAG